jgi:hypothetical protein
MASISSGQTDSQNDRLWNRRGEKPLPKCLLLGDDRTSFTHDELFRF